MLRSSFFTLQKVWILFALFFVSLGSYYFSDANLYLFQIAGLLLFVPFGSFNSIVKGKKKIGLLFCFFFYVYFVNNLYLIFGINDLAPSKLFFPILALLCCWFVSSLLKIDLKFKDSLKIVLITHCIFFLFQFFWFLITGIFIDFLEPVTGEAQRAFGGGYEISFLPQFIRPTGLFNEPGTYATYVMLMLVLYKDICVIADSIKRKDLWIEMLAISTVLLSFSVFGYVYVILYVLFSKRLKHASGFHFTVLVVIALGGLALFWEYFQQRFQFREDDSGLEFRLTGILSFFQNLNWLNVLFGRGFSADLVTWNGDAIVLQDIGFWFGLIYYFGILGLILFSFFLFVCLKSAKKDNLYNSYFYLLIGFMLLSKLTLTSILILILLFYIAMRSAIGNKLRLNCSNLS